MSVLLDGSIQTEGSSETWTGKWYYVNTKDKVAALPFQYKRTGDTVPSDLLEYVSFYHPDPGKFRARANAKSKSGAIANKSKASAFAKKKARLNPNANTAAAEANTVAASSSSVDSGDKGVTETGEEGEREGPLEATNATGSDLSAEGDAAAAAAAEADALAAYPGLKPAKLNSAHPMFGLWEGTFDVCAPKPQAELIEHAVPETFFLHSYLGTPSAEQDRDLACLPADAHFSCSALRAAPVQLLPLEMMPTQLGGMGRMRSESLALDDMVHATGSQGAVGKSSGTSNSTTSPSTAAAATAVKEEGTVAKATGGEAKAGGVKAEDANDATTVSVSVKTETGSRGESTGVQSNSAGTSKDATEVRVTENHADTTEATARPAKAAIVTDGSGTSPLIIFVGFGRNRFGRFSLTATYHRDDKTFVAEKRYMQSKGATALRKSRKNMTAAASDTMSTRPRGSVDAYGMSLSSVMPPNTKRKRVSTGYRRGSDDFAYGDDEEFYGTGAASNSTHQKARGRGNSSVSHASAGNGADVAPDDEVLDTEDDVDYRSACYDDVSGEVYEGGWHNKKRHGRGICLYADGSMYEGPWLFGKEHGHGQLLTSDRKILYTGEWMDGLMHGHGSYNFYNGDRYQGDWREGNRHGKGEFTTRDGCKYVGDWKENRRSGRGIFTWADGSQYDGEWDEDSRHGKGTLLLQKGFQYEGTWSRNFFDGRGTVVFPSGQKYEGTYRAGLREGRGSITFPEGAVYEGRFRDDRLDGQGTIKVSAPMAGPEDGERMIPIEIQADMRRIHLKAGFGEDPGH